jgi:hypothetical protein
LRHLAAILDEGRQSRPAARDGEAQSGEAILIFVRRDLIGISEHAELVGLPAQECRNVKLIVFGRRMKRRGAAVSVEPVRGRPLPVLGNRL